MQWSKGQAHDNSKEQQGYQTQSKIIDAKKAGGEAITELRELKNKKQVDIFPYDKDESEMTCPRFKQVAGYVVFRVQSSNKV